jgi:amino acid permease
MNDKNTEDIYNEILEDESTNANEDRRKELRLSIHTKERDRRLAEIRDMGCWDRVFRPMEKGSLRGVVIMWIRMTLGVGVLTLPNYVSNYGYVYGCLAIIAAGLLNLHSFHNIFHVSASTGEKDYLNLIEKTLGKFIFNIFKVTFFLDMSSSFVIMIIVCWNLFEYSLYFLGFATDDWFKDKNQMKFDEDHPTVFRVRGAFMLILYLISIPFFLRKTLRAIQKITIMILFLLLILLVFIIGQAPFFYMANSDSERIPFKPFKANWIECFFSILLSFYVQPFIFSLREELLVPSQKRMNKVAKITVSFEILLFIAVALAGYFSLGEKYITELFLTRQPYKGESPIIENIYRILIGIFFFLSSMGIAIFNPTMRDYLYQVLNLSKNKVSYVTLSLVPFFFYVLVSFIKPNIIDVFNWTGLTICNFNGYIIPALMMIQVLRQQNAPKWRIGIEVLQVVALFTLCIIGVIFKYNSS